MTRARSRARHSQTFATVWSSKDRSRRTQDARRTTHDARCTNPRPYTRPRPPSETTQADASPPRRKREQRQRRSKHVRQRRFFRAPARDDPDGAPCFLLAESEVHEVAGRRGERVRLSLANVNSSFDAFPSQHLFGVQPVVCSTHDAQVVWCIPTAERPRCDMVELEEGARRAPKAVLAHVGASLSVARDHLTSNGSGDASLLGRACDTTRSARLREPLPFELREQRVERLLHDHRKIAARIAVAHEVRRSFELLAGHPTDRQLQLVARLRERLDARRRGRRRCSRQRRQLRSRNRCLHSTSNSRRFSQLADRRRNIRARRATHEQLLDLPLRLAGGRRDELVDVRSGEVVPQQNERRQVHRPLSRCPIRQGKRLTSLAALIRRNADPSLMRRRFTQNSKSEPHAALRCSRRSSTSASPTTMRASSRRASQQWA